MFMNRMMNRLNVFMNRFMNRFMNSSLNSKKRTDLTEKPAALGCGERLDQHEDFGEDACGLSGHWHSVLPG